MAAPKVIHGARVLVYVGKTLVGSFHNITYNLAYDTQDAYVLGRFSAAEIAYTAQEPIAGTLSGWHVAKGGPHIIGLPQLQDLLTADYTNLVVVDRLDPTGRALANIKSVRLTGTGRGHAARQLSELSIPFKGIMMSDESADNAEPSGSADLTPP